MKMKILFYVFVIHLILVGLFAVVVLSDMSDMLTIRENSEVIEGWMLFTIIDSPTFMLFSMLVSYIGLELNSTGNDVIDWIIIPMILFQIIGTVNWFIFVCCIQWGLKFFMKSTITDNGRH